MPDFVQIIKDASQEAHFNYQRKTLDLTKVPYAVSKQKQAGVQDQPTNDKSIARKVNEILGIQEQPSTGKSMAQIVNDSYQKGKESYQPVVLTPKSNDQKNLTTNTAAPTITYTTANFILPGCSILVLIIALVLFIKNKRLQQKTSTQARIQQTHINNPQKKKTIAKISVSFYTKPMAKKDKKR